MVKRAAEGTIQGWKGGARAWMLRHPHAHPLSSARLSKCITGAADSAARTLCTLRCPVSAACRSGTRLACGAMITRGQQMADSSARAVAVSFVQVLFI